MEIKNINQKATFTVGKDLKISPNNSLEICNKLGEKLLKAYPDSLKLASDMKCLKSKDSEIESLKAKIKELERKASINTKEEDEEKELKKVLLQEARSLGLEPHYNLGSQKLQELIQNHKNNLNS